MTPVMSQEYPSAADVARIAAESDIVMRNLWITWTYYRLNQAMGVHLGADSVTWSGYAAWASKTAGHYIRQEEFGPLIEEWVQNAASRAGAVASVVAHTIGILHRQGDAAPSPGGFSLRGFAQEVMDGASQALANGNRVVFASIAPQFVTIASLWNQYQGKVPEGVKQQFLDYLRGVQVGDYLVPAFTAMFAAAEAGDPRVRAQAILHANGLIGCEEQTRLQPSIANAMSGAITDLFGQRLELHLRDRFANLVAAEVRAQLQPLVQAMEDGYQVLSTKLMMRMALPGEILDLGADVPPLPDGTMYPEELAALETPQPLGMYTTLQALEARGSGAMDWVSFAQRMRYIAVLFRSRQRLRALWGAPFTDSQISQLLAGQMPTGQL